MYKDKDKQREVQRNWVRQKRAAKGSTEQGSTTFVGKEHSMECDPKILKEFKESKPKRGKDIKCFEDLHPEIQATIRAVSESNEEFKRRTAIAIHYQHMFPERYEPKGAALTNVVTGKPGDPDYNGVCTPEWIAKRKAKVDKAEDVAGTPAEVKA